MPLAKQLKPLSVQAYLEGEANSQIKHELLDGLILAMAGASANHERIANNIIINFGTHLRGKPCEPFGSDMKVRVRDNFFYPDVLVDCNFDESEPYFTTTPVIIVEVISRSTRKMDEKTKLLEYINILSLKEYVTIEQDFVDITVHRKSDDWRSTHYFLEEEIYFESIDLTLAVAEIYHRVKNRDMEEFLLEKKEL